MHFLITVLALGFVIFVHELGHMIAAKRSGIGVYEFSIGMGPKLLSKQYKETLYSLRLFPLGGFVRLAGIDDRDDKVCLPEENYYNKPIRARLLTISAGSIMNIVLGFFLFVIIYSLLGVAEIQPIIKKVMPESPAFRANLKSGDYLVSVNQSKVEDVYKDFISVINKSAGQSLVLGIRRDVDLDGNTDYLELEVTPESASEQMAIGQIGILLDSQLVRYNPIKAVGLGVNATLRNISMVFISFKMLINGQAGLNDMAGPLGIIQFASFSLSRGLVAFFEMMAMISISLGVINLFPFPVLDGGHIVFLLVEAVRGKPVKKQWEIIVSNVGAAILISFMVVVIFNDIIHWAERVQLLRDFQIEK